METNSRFTISPWDWWRSEVLHEMFIYDWMYESWVMVLYGPSPVDIRTKRDVIFKEIETNEEKEMKNEVIVKRNT